MPLPRLPLLAALVTMLAAGPAPAAEVLVFAASSLKTALDPIAADWSRESGNETVISYAGSSVLARQIIQGAPADIFISANEEWMNSVDDAGLLQTDSRADLLGNTLVLVAPAPDTGPPADTPAAEIGPGFDLRVRLGDGYLAMALVEAVPAGIYGKAALSSLGLWDAVADSVAQVDNVRAALALVAAGEAPLGVVYGTDALAEPNVVTVGHFPPDSHPPIRYPAATLRDASPEAAAFLGHLRGPNASAEFARQGFDILGR